MTAMQRNAAEAADDPSLEERRARRPRVCYLRVPKTASSSVTQAIRKVLRTTQDDEIRLDVVLRGANDPRVASAVFAAGYFSWQDATPLLANPAEWVPVITFRDPLARTISHYRYRRWCYRSFEEQGEPPAKYTETWKRPLRDLIHDEASIFYGMTLPIHTLLLGGEKWKPALHVPSDLRAMSPEMQQEALGRAMDRLDRLAWVGVAETLERDLETLAFSRGWPPLEAMRANVTPTARDEDRPFEELDAETRRVLVERLAPDYLLVESAREVAAERHRQMREQQAAQRR
jgi:hypothetical protein